MNVDREDVQTGGYTGTESALEKKLKKLEYYRQELRENQNLPLGILGGMIAALVGAALWAVITVVTGIQLSFMAVGVGILVGLAVRATGKGIDRKFGVVGALLALFGCLAGNLFTVCSAVAHVEGTSFFSVLVSLDTGMVLGFMVSSLSAIDLLFYGIAIYEGYTFSFRRISREDFSSWVT